LLGATPKEARIITQGRQPEGRSKHPEQLGGVVAKPRDIQEPSGFGKGYPSEQQWYRYLATGGFVAKGVVVIVGGG